MATPLSESPDDATLSPQDENDQALATLLDEPIQIWKWPGSKQTWTPNFYQLMCYLRTGEMPLYIVQIFTLRMRDRNVNGSLLTYKQGRRIDLHGQPDRAYAIMFHLVGKKKHPLCEPCAKGQGVCRHCKLFQFPNEPPSACSNCMYDGRPDTCSFVRDERDTHEESRQSEDNTHVLAGPLESPPPPGFTMEYHPPMPQVRAQERPHPSMQPEHSRNDEESAEASHAKRQEVHRPGAAATDAGEALRLDCSQLKATTAAVEAHSAQLRAESEALRHEVLQLKAIGAGLDTRNAQLRAENEALRQQAETFSSQAKEPETPSLSDLRGLTDGDRADAGHEM